MWFLPCSHWDHCSPCQPLCSTSPQLAVHRSSSQHCSAHAVGQRVLLCCARALLSLQGPWLCPGFRPSLPKGWWPEQEGLFETPGALDLFTLQGGLLLAWLTCADLSLLQCLPTAGPQFVLLLLWAREVPAALDGEEVVSPGLFIEISVSCSLLMALSVALYQNRSGNSCS